MRSAPDGAEEEIDAALTGAPALDDSYADVQLEILRETGAEEQAATLADRAAAHAALDNPTADVLLQALREAGAEEQARKKLVDRPFRRPVQVNLATQPFTDPASPSGSVATDTGFSPDGASALSGLRQGVLPASS